MKLFYDAMSPQNEIATLHKSFIVILCMFSKFIRP